MPPAITPEQRDWEPELEAVHAQTNTLDDELLAMDEVIAATHPYTPRTLPPPLIVPAYPYPPPTR